jgi:polyhydroxyalkanoate synthesis regulator phasin
MTLNLKMVNKQQSIQTSLLLIIVITIGMFFSDGNIIPILALHEEQQLLNNYDDLQEFADAVKGGDEELEDIPVESMEASDIYEDADESLQECIDLAAEVGDSLTDKEVVHCVDDVNYFKNKYSTNSSVPITTPTNTTTGTIASTGTNNTSTSNGISTVEDEESNLINELVKTGKVTEEEARELVTKAMNNGTNEANVTADVPEANVTADVPEANVTADVPEANVTADVP